MSVQRAEMPTCGPYCGAHCPLPSPGPAPRALAPGAAPRVYVCARPGCQVRMWVPELADQGDLSTKVWLAGGGTISSSQRWGVITPTPRQATPTPADCDTMLAPPLQLPPVQEVLLPSDADADRPEGLIHQIFPQKP